MDMSFGLIVLLLLYIGLVTILPIKLANPNTTLPRLAFFARAIATFVVLVILGVLSEMGGQVFAVLDVILGTAGAILLILWACHRTNSIGWSKWLNLLTILPVINLIWLIALMVVPPRQPQNPAMAPAT